MKIEIIEISQDIIDKVNIAIYGSLEAAAKARKAEEKAWCSCESSSDTYYVPDNIHPKCSKHHWRCNDCKKIVQIG